MKKIGEMAFNGSDIDLEVLEIPEGVTLIKSGAFQYCNISKVIVPESMVYIEEYAFNSCPNLTEITIKNPDCEIGDCAIDNGWDDDNNERYFSGTIYGYENSTAQEYAENHGYTFEILSENPEITTSSVTTAVTTTQTNVTSTNVETTDSDISETTASTVSVVTTTDVTTAQTNVTSTNVETTDSDISETTASTVSTMMTTAVTTSVTTTEPFVKGDANGDGVLRASDAAFIAKNLAEASILGIKITAEEYPSMDFNYDGKVTAADAAAIAKYLAELSIGKK